MSKKSYVFSETAFHHEGDFDYIIKLIDASKKAGVNGVKFQVLTDINDFVSTKHEGYEQLKQYCFSIDQWRQIFDYTISKGLDIILMPLNIQACTLIEDFKIKFLEIHSVSFNDKGLLTEIKKSDVDVIIGVGGRKLEEIYSLKNYLGSQLQVLMVGFQSYPSELKDIKLSRIKILKELFPDIKIGYTDHSSYENDYAVLSNDYARILGAEIFEKHITLVEGVKRVDYESAIGVEKLKEIVERLCFLDAYVLNVENLLAMDTVENNYRKRQLICVASKDIEKGTIFSEYNVCMKMLSNDTVEAQNTFDKKESLIGKEAKTKILKDQAILKNNLK